MRVILTRHTAADLLAGIEWFDQISFGLGDQFEAEFYIALQRVKDNPNLFAPDHNWLPTLSPQAVHGCSLLSHGWRRDCFGWAFCQWSRRIRAAKSRLTR